MDNEQYQRNLENEDAKQYLREYAEGLRMDAGKPWHNDLAFKSEDITPERSGYRWAWDTTKTMLCCNGVFNNTEPVFVEVLRECRESSLVKLGESLLWVKNVYLV